MPLLILAVGALLTLLLGALVPDRFGTTVGIVTVLCAAFWAVLTPPAPVAPTLGVAFTPFARFFTVLFSLTAAVTFLLSRGYNERQGIRGEEYPATVLFAVFGMTALSMSVNLLTFFLGLEALTFAFYILVAIDRNRPESAEAGLKYLLLGAIAAAFIAFGIAFIYAEGGTLDIAAAMKSALSGGRGNPLALAGWGFLLIGIAFKISLVPAHLWTPDVYQGAPTPVVAFLSTGSKGAAFAALLLLLGAMDGTGLLRTPLWWLSLLSMAVGNLAALLQTNLKRMLAYSSIAQMGYVTLALLTGSGRGYEAVAFYVVAYTAMNLAAFGAVASLTGKGGMEEVEDYRGIGYQRPLAGGVLALAMFALAGVPPTAGFMGKFYIFFAAIRGGETPLAVIGILTAAVSVYYYLRVVVNLYMHPAGARADAHAASPYEVVALGVTAVAILVLGVYPEPLLKVIEEILS